MKLVELLFLFVLCKSVISSDGCKSKQRLLVFNSIVDLYEIDLETYETRKLTTRSSTSYHIADFAVDNSGSHPIVYVSRYAYSPTSSFREVKKLIYNDDYEVSSENVRLAHTDMKCNTLAYEPVNRLLFCGSYHNRNVLYEIAVDGTYKRFRFDSYIEILRVFNGFLYVNFKFLTIEQFPVPLKDKSPLAKIKGWPTIGDFYADEDLLYYSWQFTAGEPWLFRASFPDGRIRETLLWDVVPSEEIYTWTKIDNTIVFGDHNSRYIHKCESLNGTGFASCPVIATGIAAELYGRMSTVQFQCISSQPTSTNLESAVENWEVETNISIGSTAAASGELETNISIGSTATESGELELAEDTNSIECNSDKESFYDTFVMVSVVLGSFLAACIGLNGLLILKILRQRGDIVSEKKQAMPENGKYAETNSRNGRGCRRSDYIN